MIQPRYKITYKTGRVAFVDKGIYVNTGEEIEQVEELTENKKERTIESNDIDVL